jgi:hypothetical protein
MSPGRTQPTRPRSWGRHPFHDRSTKAASATKPLSHLQANVRTGQGQGDLLAQLGMLCRGEAVHRAGRALWRQTVPSAAEVSIAAERVTRGDAVPDGE